MTLVSFDEFLKEMLKNPVIKVAYKRLGPKYRREKKHQLAKIRIARKAQEYLDRQKNNDKASFTS